MPHHILFFLPFIIAFFLLPCILCSDPFYQYCKDHTSTKCGYITLEYPLVFAGIDYVYDYGCGSPYSSHFHCVNGKQPSFTINHSNYTILNVSDDRRTCTIASEKVRNKNCDPSDYSYLRESSPDIHIASEYEMNITLLPCDNPLLNESNFFFGKLNCNSTWYYSFNNTSLPPPSLSCGPRVEVPVKVGSTFEEIPPNFLQEGFQIQWQENESFSQSCEFCEKSGGYCGYNVLNLEFVCSCQDTIHAKDCGDGGGSKSQPTGAIIGASLGGAVLVAAVVGIIVYRKRRKHPPGSSLIASDVSTPGYLDPEYHQSFHLTEKSDVYSFGVVLMEIISGKLAVDITRKRREVSLAYMAIAKIQEGALHELVDPKLDIQSNTQLKAMVAAVAELAFRCLAAKKDHRPFMKEVAAELERIGKMTDVTPEKFQSSQGITEL